MSNINRISLTNMSILYTSILKEQSDYKPEIKEKPRKVEKTSKSNRGNNSLNF